MKLASVLSLVNQVERSKFINCLDKLCSEASEKDKELEKKVQELNCQLKNASSVEITQLFQLIEVSYIKFVKEQLSFLGGEAVILINILSRDGNSVARSSWVEKLYQNEWNLIDSRSKEIYEKMTIENNKSDVYEAKILDIYFDCLKEALDNDQRINRETKITADERGILNTLATKLEITMADKAAIEHIVSPISFKEVYKALESLRELGLLFISRKTKTIYIPDEIVRIFNEIQGKKVADKHLIRILRTMSDPELSNILKSHNKRIKGVGRVAKIKSIVHMGVSLEQLLSKDLYNKGSNALVIKERLKKLIQDLDLKLEKIGATAEERITLISETLNNSTEVEFDFLSASGFKEMLNILYKNFKEFDRVLKTEFELEPIEEIDSEKLRALSITPYDLLFILNNEQIKLVAESIGVSKRGNVRLNILKGFANATDKLIESYELISRRDINGLKGRNIEVNEAELGIKFEEATKAIFEQLSMTVDEDLRRSLNTSKDKVDIILSLNELDVIIGEAKTIKTGSFSKYSSTSRQVKAYVNRCENYGKRVAQVLIIAPKFSEDFIESAELDTEVNISLLEAKGLKLILDTFKSKRRPKFSPKLFTKGGLLKHNLIVKNM